MDSNLLPIAKIFSQNLFRIPDYQRGYAWTRKHIKDFWMDIVQLEDKKNHYTGVLTLEEASEDAYSKWHEDLWIINSKSFTPYYVVDGQQRLTSIIILLQVITERLSDEDLLNFDTKEEIRRKYIFLSKDRDISRSYIFGYEKDNPSYEYLKTHIYQESSDSHSTNEETIYTKNLKRAKEFFEKEVEKLGKKEIESVFRKVTQNFLFNIYTISRDIDVFVAFETMNNRGKPLSHLELLKNRLIYLSTKFEVDDVQKNRLRSVVNECWKTLYHFLGKNQNRPIDDNDFLLAHFFIYFSDALIEKSKEENGYPLWYFTREDSYKDLLLEDIFSTRRLTDEHPKLGKLDVARVYEYAHDIKTAVKLYYELQNPGESEALRSEEKVWLERVARHNARGAFILLFAVYRVKGTKWQTKVEFLKEFDRLLLFSAGRRGGHDVNIEKLALEVIRTEKNVLEVIGEIARVNELYFSSTEFHDAISNLGKTTNGFYGWKATRYFLFEYEQSLLEAAKADRKKLDWEEFSKEGYNSDYRSIEHIYPQKATHTYWKEKFNLYTVKQRNTLRNSIGNLLPLSTPKNASLGNKSFEEKKGNSGTSVGYAYGCYSEIEVSRLTDWTAKEIVDRGVKLLTFMERRWGVKLGDEQAKIHILGLEFVATVRKTASDIFT